MFTNPAFLHKYWFSILNCSHRNTYFLNSNSYSLYKSTLIINSDLLHGVLNCVLQRDVARRWMSAGHISGISFGNTSDNYLL